MKATSGSLYGALSPPEKKTRSISFKDEFAALFFSAAHSVISAIKLHRSSPLPRPIHYELRIECWICSERSADLVEAHNVVLSAT
ncbi:hypothetical protein CCR75_008586 [Bremia lactucae]|uniref:Uncharacterized protein n=1 Tax=Bremia lactucae TaxID=4779 RepID=A0A976FNW9_BRELC|nr:hypothetical protein CCR75_008586 [Bremia lactucae]